MNEIVRFIMSKVVYTFCWLLFLYCALLVCLSWKTLINTLLHYIMGFFSPWSVVQGLRTSMRGNGANTRLCSSLYCSFCFFTKNFLYVSKQSIWGGGGIGIALFRIVADNTFLDLLKLLQLDLVGWCLIFLSYFKNKKIKYWSVLYFHAT